VLPGASILSAKLFRNRGATLGLPGISVERQGDHVKIIFAFLLFTVLGALFFVPLQPQTAGTRLQMGAHWDDGTAVKGTVTVAAAQAVGPEAVVDSKPLAGGVAQLKTPTAGNSLYNVTVKDEAGTQLAKFPINMAMANRKDIQRSEIELVFRKDSKSLKSAQSRLALGS
jgi:hypothetical protein